MVLIISIHIVASPEHNHITFIYFGYWLGEGGGFDLSDPNFEISLTLLVINRNTYRWGDLGFPEIKEFVTGGGECLISLI